jgi:hypothetical protein
VSEPEIVERAAQLDAVLNSGLSQDPAANEQLAEYVTLHFYLYFWATNVLAQSNGGEIEGRWEAGPERASLVP